MNGHDFTQRTRALLSRDQSAEFTISRTALEILLADSERYGALNAAISTGLSNARANLKRGGHTLEGRQVWGRVIGALEAIRDSDGSSEAGETAKTGSTVGDSAGRQASPKSEVITHD